MADPIRALIHSRWNVDDPQTPRDLPGPRLRLRFAAGDTIAEARGEAESRALALISALPGPLDLRIVAREGSPASDLWFPELPILGDDTPAADGTPRRIHSVTVAVDHPGIAAAVGAAVDGAIVLWIHSGELLLRLFDGPDGDLWGPSEEALSPHQERFAAWCVDPPGAHDIRCQMAFVCDVAWAAMTPTSRAGVRRCRRCERDVFEVRDELDFVNRARRGECVAALPGLISVRTLASTPVADHPEHVPLAGIPARPEFTFAEAPESKRPWWRRLFGH